MVFHLALSSVTLFTFSYVSSPVHCILSSIHVNLGLPLGLFPQTLPSRIVTCVNPLEPLITCPAYSNFLLLINSLFCQKAALAIPIRDLISSSHLASSHIQLPKYLYLSTCSNITLSKTIEHFTFPVLHITTTLVFLTFIAIPYALHASFSLSIILCKAFFVSATKTASSA